MWRSVVKSPDSEGDKENNKEGIKISLADRRRNHRYIPLSFFEFPNWE